MRRTSRGAHVVLQLRAAALTLNRWNAFWRKISLYGVMIEADRTIVPPDLLHHLGITPLETHIGEGIYVSFDGMSIQLRTPREEGGDHIIVLGPRECAQPVDYAAQVYDHIQVK
jgi:hypothetical protein